jgi:hypothetical protein
MAEAPKPAAKKIEPSDYFADVKKYAKTYDEAVITKIVKHLGIALRNRDSSLVSGTDKTELDRVREKWLKKKLQLTQSDADLDKAVVAVVEKMKADKAKSRVTVYYLLAEHFGKLKELAG